MTESTGTDAVSDESGRPRPAKDGRRDVVRWACVLGVAATGVGLLDKHSELPVYVRAAERFVAGERMYRPEEPPAFTYPPFAVLPFPALLIFPEWARGPVFAAANGAMFGLTAYLLLRLFGPMVAGRRARWCAVAVALLAGRFVLSPLEYQSNDLFLVVFSVAGVAGLAWERPASGGVAFGLAAAFKATPLLFLPVLVWRRRFGAAAACVSALLVATAAPDFLGPARSGTPWAVAWYESFVAKVEVGGAADAAGAWTKWNGLNQSLSGTLYRLATPVEGNGVDVFDVAAVSLDERSIKLVTLAASGAVLLALAFVTFPREESGVTVRERRFRRTAEAGAVFAAMLLLSPMSSKQHFCVLVVPIAAAVVDVATRRRDPVVLGGLGAIAVCGSLCGKDFVGKAWGNYLQACGTITFATAVALATVIYVVSARRREGAGAIATSIEDRGASTVLSRAA